LFVSTKKNKIASVPVVVKMGDTEVQKREEIEADLGVATGPPVSIFHESVRPTLKKVIFTGAIAQVILIFKLLISTNILYGFSWNTNPNTNVGFTYLPILCFLYF